MNRGTVYGSAPPRLHPRNVRDRHFSTVGFGRRGLDPQEVRHFLHRVALELASLHQDVARLNEENIRIKRALRDWQSAQAQRRQS
ncbi:DivIVA domain-containing protein [Micromonospora narathiwatensis]|uniref:DivIVA domain-containing protein n=1 Tax=Micromonospora narathiwatensis TaxID=299146 RepID=A0A1A8Z4Z1_9ACTN|nr:DivIVA domain-containing protein [Micromonospora narathiwatensis]SBT38873.1 DivIVA domain-containing protein [Micromonospora narathiwatensis]